MAYRDHTSFENTQPETANRNGSYFSSTRHTATFAARSKQLQERREAARNARRQQQDGAMETPQKKGDPGSFLSPRGTAAASPARYEGEGPGVNDENLEELAQGPVPEEKHIVLDAGWEAGDTDPLGLFKPEVTHEISLAVVSPPVLFPTWATLAPDGWGDSLSLGTVKEPLSGNILEERFPDVRELVEAAQAAAIQLWGEDGSGGKGGWPGQPLGTGNLLAWPSLMPSAARRSSMGAGKGPSGRALLELAAWDSLDDGTVRGRLGSDSGEWVRLAINSVRESLANVAQSVGEAGSVRLVEEGSSPAALVDTALSFLPTAGGGCAGSKGASCRYFVRPRKSPYLEHDVSLVALSKQGGIAGALVSLYQRVAGGQSMKMVGWESTSIGSIPTTIYSKRIGLQRGASAILALLKAAEASGVVNPLAAATASDSSVSAESVAAAKKIVKAPPPLLRSMRSLIGTSADLFLAAPVSSGGYSHSSSSPSTNTPAPAILRIRVGGVEFRDHPIFTAEDYGASNLRGAFAEYERRRAHGIYAVDAADNRLRVLLEGVPGEFPLSLASHAAANPWVSESHDALASRGVKILSALESRVEAVASCSEAMEKVWRRWVSLQSTRSLAEKLGRGVEEARADAVRAGQKSAAQKMVNPAAVAGLAALPHSTLKLEVFQGGAFTGGGGKSLGDHGNGLPPTLELISRTLHSFRERLAELNSKEWEALKVAGHASGGDSPRTGALTPAISAALTNPPPLTLANADFLASASRAGACMAAARLLEEFEKLESRLRRGSERMGAGWGLGDIGSGCAHLAGLFEAAEAGVGANPTFGGAGRNLPGAIDFVFRLSADAATRAANDEFRGLVASTVSSSPLPLLVKPTRALSRRRKAARVALALCLNGKVVALSEPSHFPPPSFLAEFDFDVSLRLWRRPRSLSIKIIDASSPLWPLLSTLGLLDLGIGSSTLGEVLIPIPGAADMGEVGGGGAPQQGESAGFLMGAFEPVRGIFSFSCTQPMDEDACVWNPSVPPPQPQRPKQQQMNLSTSGEGSGQEGQEQDSESGVSEGAATADGSNAMTIPTLPPPSGSPFAAMGFLSSRQIAGDIAVTVFWEPTEDELKGDAPLSNPGAAGESDVWELKTPDAVVPSSVAGEEKTQPTLSVLGGIVSALGDAVRGRIGVVDPAKKILVGARSGRSGGKLQTPTSLTSQLTLLADLSSVAIPKVLMPRWDAFSGEEGGGGGVAAMGLGGVGGATLSGYAISTPNNGVQEGGSSTELSLPGSTTMVAMTKRLSQAREERERGVRHAMGVFVGAHGSSASSSHHQDQQQQHNSTLSSDPNDPRAVHGGGVWGVGGMETHHGSGLVGFKQPAMVAKGVHRRQAKTFRTQPLPSLLSLASGGPTGPGGASASGGALGGMDFLHPGTDLGDGRLRLDLLRLRVSKPGVFTGDLSDGVPLRSEDIRRNAVLMEIIRQVQIQSGTAELVGSKGQLYGPVELWVAGASALGLNPIPAGARVGVPGAIDWMLTGGRSTSESGCGAATLCLMSRIKDFAAKVRNSREGGVGGAGGLRGYFSHFRGVIREAPMPALNLLFDLSWLLQFIAPKRGLRPVAGSEKTFIPAPPPPKKSDAGDAGSDANASAFNPPQAHAYRLNITLVRARNVWTRKRGESRQAVVFPYVEVHFQNKVSRSEVSVSSMPSWSTTLLISFDPPGGPSGDTSPARLADIKDNIILHLFDEDTEEREVDERNSDVTVVTRTRRWLGKVEIPFFTVLKTGGVFEADLRVDTPLVNLGYQLPKIVDVGPSQGFDQPGGAMPSALVGNDDLAGALGGVGGRLGGGGGEFSAFEDSDGIGLEAIADSSRRSTYLYAAFSIDPPLPPELGGESLSGENSAGGETPGGKEEQAASILGSTLSRLLFGSTGPTLRSTRAYGDLDSLPEGRSLLEHASRWSDKYRCHPTDGQFEGSIWAASKSGGADTRVVKAVVSNSSGVPTLVCRFIQPVRPHPDSAAAFAMDRSGEDVEKRLAGGTSGGLSPRPGSKKPNALSPHRSHFTSKPTPDSVKRIQSVDAAARFVHLLPYLADAHAFEPEESSSGEKVTEAMDLDVWNTVAETLEMGAGDDEEHALMLCNYLNWYDLNSSMDQTRGGSNGWKTYIVLGCAMPTGETVWVLRQKSSRQAPNVSLLLTATTGRAYKASDQACPLTRVGMVANGENAWANIQGTTVPWRMSWDLDDPAAWCPLFEKPNSFMPSLPPPPPPQAASAEEEEEGVVKGGGVASTAGEAPRPERQQASGGFIADILSALLPAPTVHHYLPPDLHTKFPLQGDPIYHPPDLDRAGQMEKEIAEAIRATIRILRPRYLNRFRTDTGFLRPLLLQCEARCAGLRSEGIIPAGAGLHCFRPTEAISPTPDVVQGLDGTLMLPPVGSRASANYLSGDLASEHMSQIRAHFHGYKAYGYPLHCTYKQLEDVMAMVKATGMHKFVDPQKKKDSYFAVAVVVVPYPSGIYSVWIYLLLLVRE